MKPHGPELRSRVIKAVEEDGMSRRAAAARFKVSDASAVRWVQAQRQGRSAPYRQGGDRRSKLPEHRTWLLALIETEKDLTGRSAWTRLFDQLTAELRIRLDDEEISIG